MQVIGMPQITMTVEGCATNPVAQQDTIPNRGSGRKEIVC